MNNEERVITIHDVIDFIAAPALTLEDRRRIIDTLNEQQRSARQRAKRVFRAGMRVKFMSRRTGREVTGTIQKVNRVNIDLIETGTGTSWRVSPQLLKPV